MVWSAAPSTQNTTDELDQREMVERSKSVRAKQKSTKYRKLYNINLDFIIENSK